MPPTELDPGYVEARRVLLDALTALEPHGAAVIVVGAQAIYLRSDETRLAIAPYTTDADIAVAPYTTDGDIALDPDALMDAPVLEAAMSDAGFHLLPRPGGHIEPGIWVAPATIEGVETLIPVDLIVPEGAAARGGRRGARLPTHGKRAARKIYGLEAALVDHGPLKVTALDPADPRSIDAEVAGFAALLVAKAHKLNDRVAAGRSERVDDKDAADVVRIMQSTRPEDVGTTLAELAADPIAGRSLSEALGHLEALFGRRGRPGIEMAGRALRVAMPEAAVETLCVSYTTALASAARGD